jgi:hypothetical protein
MQLRGVTPNGHPLWNSSEAGDLSSDYPLYDPFLAKHSRRTRPGAQSKAGRLGITKPRGLPWDVNEILRLRMYRTATKEDVLAAFPGRTWSAISTAARARGHRRPKLPIALSGVTVIDQILERARQQKVTLAHLDKVGGVKGYFTRKTWRHRIDYVVHDRAVTALGGRLRARFPGPKS